MSTHKVISVLPLSFHAILDGGFYDGIYFHRVIPNFMNQFGCPYAKDPHSSRSGTGGPPPDSTFTACDGTPQTRNAEGCIVDECTQKISNRAGTLSMANTGQPESGGSQFFINVAGTYVTCDRDRRLFFSLGIVNLSLTHTCLSSFSITLVDNTFLDWFDDSTESAHPVFGRIIEHYDLVVRISEVPTKNDVPVTPIQMLSIRVE